MPGVGSVLVGVDGSPCSRSALQWALEEAAAHRARLRVLCTWEVPPPPVAPAYGSVPWGVDADLESSARAALDAALQGMVVPAGVDLTAEVVEGHAATELIRRSSDADLLVVGSRGHGGFLGMLLGSVSQQVSAHAHCPVVVVR